MKWVCPHPTSVNEYPWHPALHPALHVQTLHLLEFTNIIGDQGDTQAHGWLRSDMKSSENCFRPSSMTCHGLSSGSNTTALPIFSIATRSPFLGKAHRLALAVLERLRIAVTLRVVWIIGVRPYI